MSFSCLRLFVALTSIVAFLTGAAVSSTSARAATRAQAAERVSHAAAAPQNQARQTSLSVEEERKSLQAQV